MGTLACSMTVMLQHMMITHRTCTFPLLLPPSPYPHHHHRHHRHTPHHQHHSTVLFPIFPMYTRTPHRRKAIITTIPPPTLSPWTHTYTHQARTYTRPPPLLPSPPTVHNSKKPQKSVWNNTKQSIRSFSPICARTLAFACWCPTPFEVTPRRRLR